MITASLKSDSVRALRTTYIRHHCLLQIMIFTAGMSFVGMLLQSIRRLSDESPYIRYRYSISI